MLPLTLALARDSSLAENLYPVCKALAGSVVEGCSRVTCDSFADLTALLDSPRWGGGTKAVTGLCLTSESVASDQLGQPPAAFLMVWLKVQQWKFSDVDLALLLRLAPKCPDLQLLTIRGISKAAAVSKSIAALADAARCWPQLQHFDLEWNRLGAQPARRLAAAAPVWPQLQDLNLAGSGTPQLSLKGVRDLVAAGRHWKELRHLNLSSNGLSTQGAKALARGAENWPKLQTLNLSHSTLGDWGVEAVASAGKHWPLLQDLNLSFNGIGADGSQALASAGKQWMQLQVLDLRGNSLGAGGQAVLQGVPHWEGRIKFED